VTAVGSDTWARRSLFYLFSKPVLVAEFFLPHLL
jgi:chorismate-pyruvate lyase